MLPCFQSLSPHTDPPPTALARTSGEVDATATSTLPLLTQNDAHLANQLSTLPSDSLPCGSAALSIVRDSQPPRPNAISFATSTACSPPMSIHVQTSTSPGISAASTAIASLPSPPAAHPTETQHLGCPAGATTGAAAALPFFTKMTLQLHPTCSRSRNTRLHVLHKLRQPPFLIHRRNDAASNRFPALCFLFARKPRCLFSRQMTFHLRLGYLRSPPPREHISLLLCTNLYPNFPFTSFQSVCWLPQALCRFVDPTTSSKTTAHAQKSEIIRSSVYERPRKIKSSAVLPRLHQRLGWKPLLPLPTAGGVLLPLPRAEG